MRNTESQSQNFRRDDGVLIRPSTDDSTAPLTDESLVEAITDVLNAASIDTIEFLSYPATSGEQVHYCRASPTATTHHADDQWVNANDPDEDLSPTTRTLLESLQTTLGDGVELVPAGLSFDSLGRSAVRTSRLLSPERSPRPDEETTGVDSFATLLSQLRTEPHLYQVVLQDASDTPCNQNYVATVRVAIFGPEHQVTDEADLADLDRNGPSEDPLEIVASLLDLRSSLSALSGTSRASGNRGQVQGFNTGNSAVRRIQRGTVEYWNLLAGDETAREIYEMSGYRPKIPLRENDLQHVLGLEGIDRNENVWEEVPGREQPTVDPSAGEDTTTGGSEAPHASISAGDGADSGPQESARTVADRPNCGDAEGRRVEVIAQLLREQGYDTAIVAQDDRTSPDLWARADEEIHPVTIVEPRTAPAELLDEVAKADQWDHTSIVVALEAERAAIDERADEGRQPVHEWATGVLAKPFREVDRGRTRLYNRGSPVETDDGKQLLLPDDVEDPTAEWWMNPDGRLELEVDGTLVAEGAAETAIETMARSLDRFYTDDEGRYVVENADNTRIDTYSTEEELQRNRTTLQAPHLPVDLSYLSRVESVQTLTRDGLIEAPPRAPWHSADTSERHAASLDDFFGTFLVERANERLRDSECREVAREWIGSLTSGSLPSVNEFAHHRKKHTDRRRTIADGEKYLFYEDMSWRFPRGLSWTALANVGDAPDLPDNWSEISQDGDRSPSQV